MGKLIGLIHTFEVFHERFLNALFHVFLLHHNRANFSNHLEIKRYYELSSSVKCKAYMKETELNMNELSKVVSKFFVLVQTCKDIRLLLTSAF